eukprot:CAMPEP_0113701376 /NCGR_PEP_ID=MMETSP0038_2-20120614/24540_1 /TAXON_ID=2898 /ORGANISM="Cryptomonas paramecium" /LENGTH=141 /DNA_ID=CAMNT_0000625261 /DNA_START=122 /DNA_END=543 /DNA_ORIENTATION=+ /assembly_acc=CAM_ASM_000170
MSGIAPGSYLAYGIPIEAIRNESIVGAKRERPDEIPTQTMSSTWIVAERNDILKREASRTKYKCSLCGQAKKGHVCMAQKGGGGASWKDKTSQAPQGEITTNRQALVQKLQERLGKRHEAYGPSSASHAVFGTVSAGPPPT